MGVKNLPRANHLLLMGIVLLVFGCMAIAAPAVAGTSVVIVIGVLLLGTAVAQLVNGFRETAWSSKLPSLILGIITCAGGLAVLAHPLLGLTFLTLVLAAYFVAGGIWKCFTSFSYRPALGWFAMLLSGLVDLLLGYLIWRQWPLSGLWAVGILVGVDLIVTATALLILAATVRKLRVTTE